MKKRTISAIIFMAILVSCFLISSRVFAIFMLLVGILGFNEFFKLRYGIRNRKIDIVRILGILSLIFIMGNNLFYIANINLLIVFPLIALTLPVVFYNDNKLYSIQDAFFVISIIYLLGFSLGHISYLREIDMYSCIFIFIIAFITDTYAYIGGSLIGRHKFTSISPNKTVEGSLIGAAMGTIVGSVFYYNMVGGLNLPITIILSLLLCVLSEIGDLLFSAIKRYYDRKDFSNLIPGHGGILDRFDSVIYVTLGLLLIISII